MEAKKIHFFNKLSLIILIATISVSFFFFIPYVSVTVEASKGFLLSVGATLSLFFWLIARLGEGKFTLPKDKLILFAGMIPLLFLIASFFSSSLKMSLFGSGFEVETTSTVLLLFIVFFLSCMHFQTEKRLWAFLASIFLGSLVFLIIQLLNFFIGLENILPGFLQGVSTGTFAGDLNNFVLIIGLIILLSLLSIELLRTKKLFQIIQYFLLIVGLFYLSVINIPLVWLLVGIFSVVIFVYTISIQNSRVPFVVNGHHKYKFPFTSLVVVFVALIFLVGNNTLGNFIAKYINVSNPSVRPSLVTTAKIGYKALWHNPALGTGPNTFVNDWALWQPREIAQTVFSGVDFSNGYSFLTTLLATTGILGIIAFIIFIVLTMVRNIKLLRVALDSALHNYFTISILFISIYSWITVIVYTPNIIMLILAFASSGVLVSALVYRNLIPVKTFSFLNDPRNSFFSILGLMILMVATISLTYVYVDKFTSIIYFSKGLNNDGTQESLIKSEKMILRAISLNKNDVYYRTLSQVYLNQIGILINDETISKDTLKNNLQQLVNYTQEASSMAIKENPKQYRNYSNLGDVYASFVPLAVENSYQMAMSAYNKAQELAPNNPSILLSKASLEMANKNNEEAKKYINEALVMKSDYIDAIFLLAQIDTSEGNIPEAIKKAEYAAQLNPSDSTIFFRLGLLRYNNSEYSGAVDAFEQSVYLNPRYMNARYFLGQAYNKVGRKNDALIQFKILSEVYPESKEIKDAIDSLSFVSAPTATPSLAQDDTDDSDSDSKDTDTKAKKK